jgi:hypothetical protein
MNKKMIGIGLLIATISVAATLTVTKTNLFKNKEKHGISFQEFSEDASASAYIYSAKAGFCEKTDIAFKNTWNPNTLLGLQSEARGEDIDIPSQVTDVESVLSIFHYLYAKNNPIVIVDNEHTQLTVSVIPGNPTFFDFFQSKESCEEFKNTHNITAWNPNK